MTVTLHRPAHRTAKTLDAQRPLGGAMLWALPFLLVFFSALELLVRQPAIQDRLAYPRLGSSHNQLGAKYALLQTLAREVGHVDCIAIGSSTVDQAFNPLVFAAAYQEETGQTPHCFNFAIDALVPTTSHQIAAILTADFQPGLLIVGTDARDLTIAQSDWDATVIADTPWVRYRNGQWNVRGWLTEYVYAYRYGEQIKHLIHANFAEALRPGVPRAVALGHTPKEVTGWTVASGVAPNQNEILLTYYRDRLGNYHILPENTDGLRRIMQLNSPHTQVIVVEMPVSSAYLDFFQNPDADYNAFLTHVRQLADTYQIPFWTTTELDLVPDNGWYDFGHVNVVGADAFSAWLGHQIGAHIQGKQPGVK